MSTIVNMFLAGGIVMWPLLGLLVLTLACALERSWFWYKLLLEEKQVVEEVLTTAKVDLEKAEAIAEGKQGLATARVMLAPLKLKYPSAESFHLAIKAAWDKEFVELRKGDRLLVSVIAIAPLLSILGTASGLLTTFSNFKPSRAFSIDFSPIAAGIVQAAITSTTGVAVAIVAFIFFRIFVCLRSRQMDFISQVSNELELIYLQNWYKPWEFERVAENSLHSSTQDN
jgi:biopolymer transport protein ExbB